MTILHSEPSSGMSTRILCLTSYNKSLTPTTTLTAATLTAATFTAATTMQTLQPSTPNSTQNFNTNLNQHQNQNHGAVTPQDSEQQLEELDIEAELRADGDQPFPIDRRAIKDVVQEKLGVRVERVAFLSAGTFHKVCCSVFNVRGGAGGALVICFSVPSVDCLIIVIGYRLIAPYFYFLIGVFAAS